MAEKDTPQQASAQGASRPPEQRPAPPWRTEGLPKGQPPKRRPGWVIMAAWFLGYVVFFGILTLQDRMGGPRRHNPGRAQESRAAAGPISE